MNKFSINIKFKFIIILCMLFIILNLKESVKASGLNVGDYITFGKYRNENILWRVIHKVTADDISNKAYKGYQQGDFLLLSDKILCLKCFDAKDDSEELQERKDNGSDNWKDSNIKAWLNSEQLDMDLFYYGGEDEAPIKERICNQINEYDEESGFLSNVNFKAGEVNFIRQVVNRFCSTTNPEAIDQKSMPYQSSTDKVFLLDNYEIDDYLIDKLTYEKVQGNLSVGQNYSESISRNNILTYDELIMFQSVYSVNNPYKYWLRDCMVSDTTSIVEFANVNNDSTSGGTAAYISEIGIRPALYLKGNEIELDDDKEGTRNSPHIIINIVKDDNTSNLEEVNIGEENKKYFKYYIGLNKYNIITVKLVCCLDNEDNIKINFNRDDIIENNKFKLNILYIDDNGDVKKYK